LINIELSEIDVDVLIELISQQDKFDSNFEYTKEDISELNKWGDELRKLPQGKRSEYISLKIDELQARHKKRIQKVKEEDEVQRFEELKEAKRQLEDECAKLTGYKNKLNRELKEIDDKKAKGTKSNLDYLKEIKGKFRLFKVIKGKLNRKRMQFCSGIELPKRT
jgi:chromosome segregation ATPase